MASKRSECLYCGGIVPVEPGQPAPEHRDWSRNERCAGTGRPTMEI